MKSHGGGVVRLATVLLLACLGHGTALGQDFRTGSRNRTVSGVVLDSVTGEPVAGADVSLRRSFRMELTDRNGRFAIAGVEDGPDDLRVRRMGYVATSVPVVVREGMAPLTILLVPEPVGLDSLEVAARRGHFAFAGMVIDSFAGTPVPRVKVSLEKANLAMLTDSAGRFSARVPPDEVITIDGLGYMARTVTLPSPLTGEVLEIRVLPDPYVLPALEAIAGAFDRIELIAASAIVWDELELLRYPRPNAWSFLEWQGLSTSPGSAGWRGRAIPAIFVDGTWLLVPDARLIKTQLGAIPMSDVYRVVYGADPLNRERQFIAIYTKTYVRQQARSGQPVPNPLFTEWH